MKNKKLNLPETPEEKDYIIAYIDLLGIKDLLSKNSESAVFENIYYTFLIADRLMPQMNNWEAIKIKVFSDNILIAFPVNTYCLSS